MGDNEKKPVESPKKYEMQIKIRGILSIEMLVKLGAKNLGKIEENDKYFSTNGRIKYPIYRIRETSGKKQLSVMKVRHTKEGIEKEVKTLHLEEHVIDDYIRKEGLKLVNIISKSRTRYRLGDFDICVDDVQGLDVYVEIQSNEKLEPSQLASFLKTIGLDMNNVVKQTYLSLMCMKQKSRILLWLRNMADKTRDFAFGITSGVMTTMGIIIGVWFGAKERIAVIAGIFAVAASDSFSDAMAMYTDEKMKGKINEIKALKKAFATFFFKAIMALTFAIPFIVIPEKNLILAIAIDIFWAVFVIFIFSLQIAAVEYFPPVKTPAKTIIRQIAIAIFIGILAFWGSRLVNLIVLYLK